MIGDVDVLRPASATSYRSVDPDDVRDAACGATASTDVCDPAVALPAEPRSPSGSGSAGTGGGLVGTLLVVVLVVALVLVLAWLLRSWWLTRHDEAGDDERDDDSLEDDDESLGESTAARALDDGNPPDRWRHRAEEHRRAQRFREAVRCEYRALVGDLARAGLVDEIPGRTSGEERGQVAALAAELSGDFDTAADLFDRAWFDDVAVTAADDEHFVAVANGLVRAAADRRIGGERRDARRSRASHTSGTSGTSGTREEPVG